MGLFALFRRERERKPIVKVAPLRRPNKKVVKLDNTPLYVKQGWSKTGNVYRGYYRTLYGAWRGEIEKRGDKFKVFIFKPPKEQIKKHSRWACFHKEKNDKWRIDLAVNPKDKDVAGESTGFRTSRIMIHQFAWLTQSDISLK